MPLDHSTRNRITEQHGAEQADIHEQLHDTIEQAWVEYSKRQEHFSAVLTLDIAALDAQIPRWEDKARWRDEFEKIDAKYQAALRAAHGAYEKACQDAHAAARVAGLRSAG